MTTHLTLTIYDATPVTYPYGATRPIRGYATSLVQLFMSPLMIQLGDLVSAFNLSQYSKDIYKIFEDSDLTRYGKVEGAMVLLENSNIATPAITLNAAGRILFHVASQGNKTAIDFLTEAAIAGIDERVNTIQTQVNYGPVTLAQLSREFEIPAAADLDSLLDDREILGRSLTADIIGNVWTDQVLPNDIAGRIILAYALESYRISDRAGGLNPASLYILAKAIWYPQSLIKGESDLGWKS